MKHLLKQIALSLTLTIGIISAQPLINASATTNNSSEKEIVKHDEKNNYSQPPITPRCYPAYKCMNKKIIPTEYTLFASNSNRGLGTLIGTSIIGAMGLIPGLGLSSFLASVGIGYNELKNGYSSYKVYIKRHPSSNKKAYLKTVYYQYPNFLGKTKTVINTF